ncbi:MAG: Slp family lipoprotein [Nitrospirota bacterium]
MKRLYLIVLAIVLLFSCAPVLRKDLMDKATRDITFSEILRNPEVYRGRLFILGGIIVETKFTDKGSLIEALYVPVDSRGYLKEIKPSNGRFLAFYPKEEGLLDPVIYNRGREITLAGEFIETRKGKVDDMEYTYPLFEIKELYLWEKHKEYYIVPPYPSWYYPYPYWWDYPWWRYHYPPPYWYYPPPLP